jgi:hypothetical protein
MEVILEDYVGLLVLDIFYIDDVIDGWLLLILMGFLVGKILLIVFVVIVEEVFEVFAAVLEVSGIDLYCF